MPAMRNAVQHRGGYFCFYSAPWTFRDDGLLRCACATAGWRDAGLLRWRFMLRLPFPSRLPVCRPSLLPPAADPSCAYSPLRMGYLLPPNCWFMLCAPTAAANRARIADLFLLVSFAGGRGVYAAVPPPSMHQIFFTLPAG